MKHLTKSLLSSLFIFSVGNLITKGIQFLLLPLYTSQLTPQVYGAVEIWAGTAELFSPIAILGIHEALFRFAVQKEKPQNTFTVGISVGLLGESVWLVCMLLFWKVYRPGNYFFLFVALVVFTGIRMSVSQFMRGMGWAGRFTAAGVCQAISLAVLEFVLLPRFGGTGYLSALLLSQLAGVCAAVGLGKLWNDWKPGMVWKDSLSKELSHQMLRYALPIIPAAFLLQLTNLSGRYFVLWFCGEEQAGLYTSAAKVGAAVRMAAGVFQQAWQYIVSLGWKEDNKNNYFPAVFRLYTGGIFLGGGVLIFCLPLVQRILLKGTFQEAGKYLPLAAAAAVFQGYSVYFSAFYLAEQKTGGLFRSAAVCLGAFLTAGFVLAPVFHVWGVLAASIFSNAVMVGLRAFGSRKWMPLGKSLWGGAFLGILFLGQAVAASCPVDDSFQMGVQIVLFLVSLVVAGVWMLHGKFDIK